MARYYSVLKIATGSSVVVVCLSKSTGNLSQAEGRSYPSGIPTAKSRKNCVSTKDCES